MSDNRQSLLIKDSKIGMIYQIHE